MSKAASIVRNRNGRASKAGRSSPDTPSCPGRESNPRRRTENWSTTIVALQAEYDAACSGLLELQRAYLKSNFEAEHAQVYADALALANAAFARLQRELVSSGFYEDVRKAVRACVAESRSTVGRSQSKNGHG